MGGVCGTYAGENTYIKRFWWGNLAEVHHMKNLGISRRIILKWVLNISLGKAVD
jgi:hypothetical protein